jgi:DNA-binding SARP family transcriptional activator/tetratricopeptide (TPR) repeat protein
VATPFDRAPDDPASAPGLAPCEGQLFGPFRLVAADGSDVTPVRRKARALVAYLLLSEGDVARDRLTTLLWSERGEEQARASLRQTLYDMRALTSGSEPVAVLDRTRARIVRSRVTTDLDRMRAAAQAGDLAMLATLVGEPPPSLLADLDGLDPDFDEWLAVERTRRGDERRRVVLEAAARSLQNGEPEAARRLASCLLGGDPTDETAARLAMEASHVHGDRDSVRQIFARLKDALRADLGVDPSDETMQLQRRLATAPILHRTAAETAATAIPAANDEPLVTEIPAPSPQAVPAIASVVTASTVVPVKRRRSLIVAIIGGVIGVIAIGAAIVGGLRSDPTHQGKHVLRVEALQVPSDNTAAQALGVGFTAELARILFGNDPTLDVVDAGRTPRSTNGRNTFDIEGEAQGDGTTLRADVRLVRQSDGAILWSRNFSRAIGEAGPLREQMAYNIADVTVCALGKQNPDVDHFSTEALRLLLAACEAKHVNLSDVVKLLTRVLELEPNFARGWAMLAVATQLTVDPNDSTAPSAQRFADRALALDPHEGEAYFARALALDRMPTWTARMDVLQRGLAVDPGNENVVATIARSLAEVGRWAEASTAIQRAVDLDPFDPRKPALRATLMGFGGSANDAANAFQVARRDFPDHEDVKFADFRFQALIGDTTRAMAMLDDPHRSFAPDAARVAFWRAIITARASPSPAHDEEAFQAELASMRADPRIDERNLEILALLHRIDDAFAAADRIDVAHYDERTMLLFTTVTQPLRADPRFMTLAARLGLVKVWQETGRWPDFCSDRSVPYDCKVEAARAQSPQARPLVAAK